MVNIWIGIATLSVVALAPAVLTSRRRQMKLRDERETALDLHRQQLLELDRDLEMGMIAPAEHAVARVEVQRRILAADTIRTDMRQRISDWRLWGGLALIPPFAICLYLSGGHPSLPAQPLAERMHAQSAKDAGAIAAINRLRDVLGSMSPSDPSFRQGYLLLGQAEAAQGHFAEAAHDWRKALDISFDPELAVRVAEAQVQAEGHVSPDSIALYRKALDAAPKDAPWRTAVESRIAQGVHEETGP
ncbi:MAG: c-type cytochrome biogenesis protein CcmI [Acetobacter sp.]|nr:c-type cytochrome biogenesis protein CcmI [Acetobacter sp.]